MVIIIITVLHHIIIVLALCAVSNADVRTWCQLELYDAVWVGKKLNQNKRQIFVAYFLRVTWIRNHKTTNSVSECITPRELCTVSPLAFYLLRNSGRLQCPGHTQTSVGSPSDFEIRYDISITSISLCNYWHVRFYAYLFYVSEQMMMMLIDDDDDDDGDDDECVCMAFETVYKPVQYSKVGWDKGLLLNLVSYFMQRHFRHTPTICKCRSFGCVLLLNQIYLTTMYRSTIPLRFIWSICSGN